MESDDDGPLLQNDIKIEEFDIKEENVFEEIIEDPWSELNKFETFAVVKKEWETNPIRISSPPLKAEDEISSPESSRRYPKRNRTRKNYLGMICYDEFSIGDNSNSSSSMGRSISEDDEYFIPKDNPTSPRFSTHLKYEEDHIDSHLKLEDNSDFINPNCEKNEPNCKKKTLGNSLYGCTVFKKNTFNNHNLNNPCEKKLFDCLNCDQSFIELKDLEKHLRIHVGEKRYLCFHCDSSFANSSGVTKHLQDLIYGYECLHCNKIFTRKSNRRRHLRKKTCELSKYTSLKSLKNGKIPLKNNKNTDKSPLRGSKHSAKNNNTDKTPLRGSKYNKCSLKNHKKRNSFRCSYCNKTFNKSSPLKRHITDHIEKPFGCAFCDQKYTRYSYLKSHVCLSFGTPCAPSPTA